MQEEFEKNWAEGTFPGWPVNILLIIQFIFLRVLYLFCTVFFSGKLRSAG